MTVARRAMTGAERMLATCRREPADATPVWFMRQAGRSLARYRTLREQYPILTLAKTPELCKQITLMPVEELGVDGAVLFADIMLPVEAMGVSLEIQPDLGPIIHAPIRDMQGVERLRPLEPEESVPFVLETIRGLRSELSDGRAAVKIGRASCRERCRSRWSPYHEKKKRRKRGWNQPETRDRHS